MPRRAGETQIRFLEFLTLSCINHGLWIWLTFPRLQTGPSASPFIEGLILFLVVFLSPILLGLLTGKWLQTDSIKSFLGRLGFFRTVHPIPTAWDYKFSRIAPSWVVVTLKDGAHVFGLFGSRSFAGDDPSERDIYLEAQFQPTPTGEWAPVEDTDGIIVKADQIAAIEFRRMSEVTDGK